MYKLKNIVAVLIIAITVYACGDDNNTFFEEFDHEAQAVKDNDSLVKFFRNFYFDTSIDSLKPIQAGETALINDAKLKSMYVTESEVDYTLYYYEIEVGNPSVDKGFPTVVDSILVKYQGKSLEKTDSLSTFETNDNASWFNLSGVIRGWSHGFTNFKGGDNATNNGPITYVNGGKGILFIPSGLAYRNVGTNQAGNLANKTLIFYFNLFDFVKDTDNDNDGVPSIMEDPDGDGDPRNDDTDGDLIPNYLDNDDDNDGVPTNDEDKNGDGNPANDFNDPNNPTLPDYLNPDIK